MFSLEKPSWKWVRVLREVDRRWEELVRNVISNRYQYLPGTGMCGKIDAGYILH